MRRAPDVTPLQHGLSMSQLLADLEIVMDGAYQPSHPGALAQVQLCALLQQRGDTAAFLLSDS